MISARCLRGRDRLLDARRPQEPGVLMYAFPHRPPGAPRPSSRAPGLGVVPAPGGWARILARSRGAPAIRARDCIGSCAVVDSARATTGARAWRRGVHAPPLALIPRESLDRRRRAGGVKRTRAGATSASPRLFVTRRPAPPNPHAAMIAALQRASRPARRGETSPGSSAASRATVRLPAGSALSQLLPLVARCRRPTHCSSRWKSPPPSRWAASAMERAVRRTSRHLFARVAVGDGVSSAARAAPPAPARGARIARDPVRVRVEVRRGRLGRGHGRHDAGARGRTRRGSPR